ncbi:MAG: alginate lyase family protein [Opitutales bacterium]|nr:alginate lyase family protein [Opitutales bacterium]
MPAIRHRLRYLYAMAALAAMALPSAQLHADHAPSQEAGAQNTVEIDASFVAQNKERIQTLFSKLDLDYPGLEDVKKSYQSGGLKDACEALLDYYAKCGRKPAVNPLNQNPDYDVLLRASDTVEGYFTEQNQRAKAALRSDGGIDWDDYGPNGDKEWAWFINRHVFFRDLGEAWLYSGNDSYTTAISSFIEDWVINNPYPDRTNFSPQWRALETARRILESWTPVFYEIADSLSPEARLLMLCSLPEHADNLHEHGSFWGGNHLLTEQSALLLLATAWPEFKDAPVWLADAKETSEREILGQSYPDGAYTELTNHYQRVVLDSLERSLRILRNAGENDEALEERAALMWDYFANVMRPNGTGPLNNAGDLDYNRSRVLEAYRAYKRDDWLYIASNGMNGSAPDGPASRFFPWAGQAVMRSGWDSHAQWAFFDIGPNGSAHQHNDRLHLSVSLGQHDILVDSGRFIYQPGKWKDYFTGASAHNIVMINGQAPLPPPSAVSEPLPVQAHIEADYDFFSAKNSFSSNLQTGSKGAEHRRSVYYKRGAYWLVMDMVLSYGETRVDTLWHFHPDVGLSNDEGGLIAWADENTGLKIKQIGGPAVEWSFTMGNENPVQGWYSPDYNTKWSACTGTASATIRSPECIVWLLWPTENGPIPACTVRKLGSDIIISVGSGKTADSIRINPDSGQLIQQ